MAKFTKEDAKAMSILDVAQSLGMELKQRSTQQWYWVEHDSFVIDTRKNIFFWNAKGLGGDAIKLVETIKEVDYKQAMHYLRTGEFPKAEMTQSVKEPFRYVLGHFEQPFIEARDYLKEVRGLSDDTINFFEQAGVLAQANKKAVDDYLEPVIVFKSLDKQRKVIGASLQGIVANKERYEGKGYLKQIANNSDGLSGMRVDIGTPKRLVLAEAPIDLMSYYEANKDNLSDVRLVAMDGLKAGTVSRYTMELLAELQGKTDYKPDLNKVGEALEKLAKVTTFFQDGKNSDLITLAVDNDKAGRDFIERLQEKGIPVQTDIPPLPEGATKMDWNDYLKGRKADMVLEDNISRDNSRLAQAERKLERLNGELVEKADRVYAHTRQANGQPMNDKRGGASFFRKQDQLEGAVFTKLDEIKKQEERVEKLRYQQDLKERGFNKQGSGLVMSVDNIPRIKDAIEAFEKGEHGFTRATINRYRKELVKLEAMKERLEATRISPGAQHLIDEGLVTQWQKQPTLYFVKGLRKVALELTENGEFQTTQKYLARDTAAVARVNELLEQQTTINNEKEQSMELEHEPRFELEFSELGRLEQPLTNFDELQTWMLQQFNSVFVGEGYFKTYLQVYSLDEQGQEVASQIRFDVGHGQSDFNPRREHIRDYLVDNGYIHLQAPKQSQEQIEVIFHSSDEPLLSRYSSGEIIPYTEFVSILYPKNAKLFNENPRTGPTVSLSNDGGTWFGLRTADGQMLVERFRYDVGLEGESISDRLNRILSPAHLEQIRQIDTNFDIPSYVEDKNKELGIEVKLYRDKEHIDTLDFNDLINHPNIEEMANELGHTSLSSYPEEFTIEILDKRLNQSQLTALLDQIIELGKEKDELKQFLTEQLTSLSQSTRPDIFRALTENERTHISEFFKTLIPNVTTSYEFTEEGVEYLSYRIRNMEFASSHPELRELSPEEQYQSLLKFFDKHYGKPFPLPSDQTVMGIELLQEKFGYNPKLPLAVYRDSAQNMDRIAEKEEEAFRSTFDKTMFAKSLELVQKYSLQEVMEGIDIWSGGDEARLEALNSDLRDISLQPLKDFVERYIDPSLYLSHGFEDSPLASLSFQDLADLSHEKGLLDVNGKLVNQKDHMEKEKALEQSQGYEKSAESTSEDLPKLNIWSSTNENAILSNLAVSPIWIRNFRFESVEHAYQTLKSNGFTSEALTWAESNRQAFKQGRKVQSAYQLGPTNKLTSITLMEKLLTERFLQDAEFREALIQTKGFTLTHKQDNGIWKKEFPRILMDLRDGKLVNQKDHMEKEKAPEQAQKHLIDRTSIGTDSLQLEAEGSVKPVSNDTFEQTVTSHPTSSYPLLHFSTNFSEIQRRVGNYHPVTEADIKRLNQYAPSIQNTAQWYSNELAGSFVYFVYASQGQQEVLSVNFRKENFVHLTGIRPFEEGKGAADFLDDFVSGRGHYDSILVSNSLKHKLQALPMLSDILDPKSFILDNLTSVEKLHKLDMSEALKSKDEDFLLLFKDAGEERIPASLMKIKGDLKTKVAAVDEKVILGIYRERSGIIDQLSINKEYVKDGGKEFLTILQNRQLEPIKAVVKEEKLEAKTIAASTDIQPTPTTDVALQSLLDSNDSQALFNHLKEGMKEYVNSDKYKQFLQAISKFHDYSIYNVHMMLSQKPDISLVASYRKWKTDFDRQVQKGEKGIKIWVPMTFKEKDKNGQPVLDADGQEKTITRFKLGTVFDVSQTAGKEIPKPVYNLESAVPDYQNIYRAARHVSQENGVKISFHPIDSGANGYYHIENNEIVIADKKMSEAQILKTLFHEMAHSELHHHNDGYSRSERELQAESIAYVVANHYGIDTSDYSFGYLHNWSQDKQGYEDLENQLKVVQAESKSLINRIDASLELVKNKTLTTNKLQSKIAQAKEKSEQQKEQKASEVRQEHTKKQPAAKEL
ncbi:PBECR4 domain-containing protein [Streptococcus suis]|uniref:PBECR4 domain-containing protein n=1 Tax=Streptococcus suis TaxID=1307 RepID=UPI001EE1021A|nr:PBECR4 domain-containing protein [Streptococcus suis]